MSMPLTVLPPPAPIIFVLLTAAPPRAPPHVQVVYETLPGWKQDISKVRRWEDLPENARK